MHFRFSRFAENPFVSLYLTNPTPLLGYNVTFEILAAQDSTGTGDNSVHSVQIYLNTTNGMIVPVGEAVTNCSAEKLECFSYSYILGNVKPEDNGIYIAQVMGKLNITFAKFLDQVDKTLATELYVHVLFLIHSVNFTLTNKLMYLFKSIFAMFIFSKDYTNAFCSN